MVVTSRAKIRFLRKAVADLAAALYPESPLNAAAAFITDPRAAREARIAILMSQRGELDRNGNGDSE